MKKIIERLNKVEEITASSLMIFTSFLVFLQVILRYAFNYSITWSEELSRYMIAWFIFLGSSMAVKDNAHVSMDVLDHIMPRGKAKNLVNVIIDIINMVFCVLVIISGVQTVETAIRLELTATSVPFPLAIAYAAVPVGITFMFIRYIVKFKNDVLVFLGRDGQEGDK